MQAPSPIVVIITWCRDLDAIYGSLLTFKTLRVGFPDTDVMVIDNGSLPEALPRIKDAAESVGATFYAQPEMAHHAMIRAVIMGANRTVIFVDPDMVFWAAMKLSATGLAGRLIQTFYDGYTDTITTERLHTSLLMVGPDVKQEITNIENIHWESDVLKPVMVPSSQGWIRYDTGAILYQAIGGQAFGEAELNCYDHIFCGSHFVSVANNFPEGVRQRIGQWHDLSKREELSELRGIWREQEAFFQNIKGKSYGLS